MKKILSLSANMSRNYVPESNNLSHAYSHRCINILTLPNKSMSKSVSFGKGITPFHRQ